MCIALEGLPLAIELAAARASVLRPEQMLERLGKPFDLLRTTRHEMPERHRSLLAAVQWSYDLLTEQEQRAFERLAVSEGGFTLDAAEAVLDGMAVLDLVQSLRDKSLLRTMDDADTPRFVMFAALREFAAGRLHATHPADELDNLYRRAAGHLAAYVEHWNERIFSRRATTPRA